MFKPIISLVFLSLLSSPALAKKNSFQLQELVTQGQMKKVPVVNCGIMFGNEGLDSPWIRLKNNQLTAPRDIGGPWNFIRKTYGSCDFTVYNKTGFKGRKVKYGSGIKSKIRVASVATADKGGWKARSVIIKPYKNPSCRITLFGTRKELSFPSTIFTNITQTFYGPSRISDISGWSIVKKTVGNKDCLYSLYNKKNHSGRVSFVKKVDNNLRVGWKIRSIDISK